MAHRLYDGARTMLIAGDPMAAGRAQAARMLAGAAALREATVEATAARRGREAAEDRLSSARAYREAAEAGLARAQDRLARARAARA